MELKYFQQGLEARPQGKWPCVTSGRLRVWVMAFGLLGGAGPLGHLADSPSA